MLALYSACRFNLAGTTTADITAVLGRRPITFAEFAHHERITWQSCHSKL
jgi:hypothetical protein